MSTKTQVGNVPLIDGEDREYHIYTEQWADEEPNLILIDGPATYLMFDPSAPGGRQRVRDLIERLNEALALHEQQVIKLYAHLSVGDYCGEIRLPDNGERRCTELLPLAHGYAICSRAAHEDGHHVHVTLDYVVDAVRHATPVDAAMAAYEATLPGQPQ